MQYSWTQKPLIKWLVCWHGTPYWHFYDPRDWEDYDMYLSLKTIILLDLYGLLFYV